VAEEGQRRRASASLAEIVEAQHVGFAARYGVASVGTASAPGRINVIGEHTDYNRGLALPGAIDRWVVVTLSPRQDDAMRLHSEAFGETVVAPLSRPITAAGGWSTIPWGAAQLFADAAGVSRGFDALIGGNVPLGAGLSSSAAVEMALLNALRDVFEADIDDLDLVRSAQRVEHECLGVATGLMDQYTSQFSRPGSLMLVDFETTTHEYVDARLDGWVWLLLDTEVRHELADSAYGERVEETRSALARVADADGSVSSFRDLLETHVDGIEEEVLRRRLRHYVGENARVRRAARAIGAGDAEGLGELMFASHDSLRDDYAVSCAELDALVAAAADAPGCAGARMMGGGFGGCTINLVRESATDRFVERISPGFERRFGYSPGADVYSLVGGVRVH
jgi:galactokinase